MSENGKEFITLYNELDSLFRKKLNLREYTDFSSEIYQAKEAKLIDSKQKDYLLLVGKLRNAIIHDDKYRYPDDPIAEPHPDTIEKLRQLKDLIETPPTIDDLPKHQPRIFNWSDDLLECLQHMRQNDFSQVVVFSGKTYDLITREDIARWFEMQIDNKEILVSLEYKKLEEILHVDQKDDCAFLHRKALLPELLEKFETQGRTRVAAVLITDKGKPTEKPINIFTQYDIPEIISKMETF